jgi:hypothetical protein
LDALSSHYENDSFYGWIKYVLSKIKFYKNDATDDEKKKAIGILEHAFDKMNNNEIKIDADLYVHYGNLIRNFLNKFNSKKYSENTENYEEFFEKAEKAYKKAQNIPKKMKQVQQSDLNSDRLGSYNDYAFLGELLLYTKKLQILNELSEQNYLDELMDEYETRVKNIMDTFEILSDGGQIYLSKNDEKKENTRIEDIKIKMGNELIRLLEMKKSKEVRNEPEISKKPDKLNVINELLSNLGEKEYNIFTILKSNKKFKIKSWEDFRPDELKSIVDYGIKLLETKPKPSYSTFKNLIYSLVYYGQLNDDQGNDNRINDKYNIHVALEYCNRWLQNYSDENHFDAFYFTAIFQLAVDLQDNKSDSESKKHFEDCQKRCKTLLEQNCNPSRYKSKEFVFGCGKGIKAIVPFNKRTQNINKLKKFKGRIRKQENLFKVIDVENDLLKHFQIQAGFIPPEISKTDETPRYFNLAFARDNLVAENFEIIRNNLSNSSDEAHSDLT